MHDCMEEVLHGVCVEGVLEGTELVQNDAQGPHVVLGVVGSVEADLGGEVVWGTDAGASLCECAGEGFADAEVTDLDVVVASEEDVLGLDIAVHDVVRVNVEQCQEHLDEIVCDLFLGDVATAAVLDECGEVAAVGVFHHDVEDLLAACVTLEPFAVADDGGM